LSAWNNDTAQVPGGTLLKVQVACWLVIGATTPWNHWSSFVKVAAELYKPQRTSPLLLRRPLTGTEMVLPCWASATAPARPTEKTSASPSLLKCIDLSPLAQSPAD